MTEDPSLDSFIAKWHARWPEWSIAESFVPAAQRDVALAWFALLQELTDAAWAGDDPTPGRAKLGWWQEELQGWARGRRRHPLGAALQRHAAGWEQLASALPSLGETRELPADVAAALTALNRFAEAATAIEQVLFAVEGGPTGAAETAATLLATHPHWPVEDAERRRELLSRWPARQGSRPRRIAAALARTRLQGGASAPRAMPGWRTLWVAWRAARH